jgi:hypothetical protein
MDQNMNCPSRRFLLMEGGPLFHIEGRLGLIKKNVPLTKRRAYLAALLAWLPLLVLSALQGTAFGHSVPVPFLHDFSAWTRFLLAVPMLILSENILGPRIADAAEHFVTSGVVDQKDYQRFDQMVAQGLRLRDSKIAELVIAVLAYLFVAVAFRYTAVHVSTWYAIRTNGESTFTWAGWWLLGISAPLLQFLLLRWLWRLFIWFRFLSQVRNLNLQLFPTHPDKAAGLSFVGETQRFFGALIFAYTIGVTGVLANDIVYDKIPLQSFAPAIACYVATAIIIVVGPLIVFAGILLRTKRQGLHQYGTLSTSYTGSFHRKWIEGMNPDNEQLLGTGDIQSLADLGNSFAYIERMSALPIDIRTLIHLVLASLIPLAPLLLAVMPLKEIVKLLFKVLL